MVGECHDLNLTVGQRAIKDGVWKTRQSYATNAAWMNQFPRIWPSLSQADNALKLFDECSPKTCALALVKLNCVKVFSFRANRKTMTHRSSARAFIATTSPETDCIFPASIAVARRADSLPQRRSNSGSETSSKLSNKR